LRDYHNEGDIDDELIDSKTLIREEIKDLFGLYPRARDVNSVIKFLYKILPDIRVNEVVDFCTHWSGSDKNHSPDHKEIKKCILQMRLRGNNERPFEPSESCPKNNCDGSGYLIATKDGYEYIFRCDCNPKSDIDPISNPTQFDDIIGYNY